CFCKYLVIRRYLHDRVKHHHACSQYSAVDGFLPEDQKCRKTVRLTVSAAAPGCFPDSSEDGIKVHLHFLRLIKTAITAKKNDIFIKSVPFWSACLKYMWDIIIIDSVHRDGEIGLIRKLEEN
ncbi:MAG: hypothetical protein ACI316_04795, partial [Lactimicrobium massiliense]